MKKMETIAAFLLSLLLIFSLFACGNEDLSTGGSSSPSPGSSASSSVSEPGPPSAANPAPAAVLELKICEINGSAAMGVGTEPDSVYFFSCPPEILFGTEELKPGMVVEVGFDGYVMEIWPMQINAESVVFKEQQTDYYSLYLQILEDIYGADDGLNGGADFFGFDFTEIEQLSENEKSLLAWNFSSAHSAEPIMGTIQELMDDGTIDKENLYWEDGLHFTVKETQVQDNAVFYSVQKWKSGLGAVGYENHADKASDGQWVFSKIESMWIS